MRSIYKYILPAVLIVSGVSCKKYLDVVPDNVGTIDYAFHNRNEAENYLFTCYSYTQRGDVTHDAAFVSSSEIVYPMNLKAEYFNKIGFNLVRGGQTSGSPIFNYWDGGNNGDNMFVPIRMCNTMLENIDKPIDLTDVEKTRWIAETKFLKAYYHYYLLRLYGPIPIIDKNFDINASPEEVMVKRQPIDSVVNFIVKLLDEAAPGLPPMIENQVKELGRVTKPSALALKAEVLMLAASPLFNGNPDYAGYKDKGKDGVSLFPEAYDAKKWQRAAVACKDAVDAAEAVGIRLYKDFSAPTVTLTDQSKQVLMLQNVVTEQWDKNPELIWCSNPTFGFQGESMPIMTAKSLLHLWSIPSTFAVPISTTDLFYTKNGVPINEDKTWDYNNRYELQDGDAANRAYIKEAYTTIKAHFNREPRFYADVAFDGGIWLGNAVMDLDKALFVQGRGVGSYSGGMKNDQTGNITGYWPKKLVNYLTTHNETGRKDVEFRIARIRMAGLYLWYAEALNEASNDQGARDMAITYLDKVRDRAGLQGVKASWTTYSSNPTKFATQDGLRKIIHQERRIELCFEAQSGWDLRRWKEMQEVLGKPMQGWSIDENQAVNYYRPRTVLIPDFRLKDYLWPIQDDNLIKNTNLVQTPYW